MLLFAILITLYLHKVTVNSERLSFSFVLIDCITVISKALSNRLTTGE